MIPFPYRFDDGRLTGFAILDLAIKHGIYSDVQAWGKNKKAARFAGKFKYDFPGVKRINEVILYLLKAGETEVIQQEHLCELFYSDNYLAFESILNYYSASAPTLESSQRPVPLPVSAVVADNIPDIPIVTEADFLLTPPVIELLEESVALTPGDSEIIVISKVKNFFLALGLPVEWLPKLDSTIPSNRITLTLKLASERGLLSYVNLITALKTVEQETCAANLIKLLVRGGRIDEHYSKNHFETINIEEQPFAVNGQPTNYLLVFLDQQIPIRQNILTNLGLRYVEEFHDAWVELHKRQSLTWNVLKIALLHTNDGDLVNIIDRKIKKDSTQRRSAALDSVTIVEKQTVKENPAEDTAMCSICYESMFANDRYYICSQCRNAICLLCGEKIREVQGKLTKCPRCPRCPLCRKNRLRKQITPRQVQ